MYINFIDFQKAFDSVHCESLWKILRAYSIPHKIVITIITFCEHFGSVIVENTLHFFFESDISNSSACELFSAILGD